MRLIGKSRKKRIFVIADQNGRMEDKMKKRIIIALMATLLLVSLFTGCGKSMDTIGNASTAPMAPGRGDVLYDAPMEDGYYVEPEYDYSEGSTAAGGSVADLIQSASKTHNLETEKIIYTAYADIETLEFDATIQAVYDMMDRFGAYIERSSVSGTDYASQYYGGKTYRRADFTIRVPVQYYSEMSVGLTELGNVLNYSSESQNITAQFTDTESRLKAYRTEYDRLLEMMKNAKNVDEMIQVEARLSEVEYSIEQLEGTLRVWQDKVDYSTININIREVHEYSEPVVEPVTFWNRLGTALMNSIEWLGDAAQDIAVFIVAAVPILIIPAIVVILIVVIVRRRRAKKNVAEAEKAAKLREEWAKKNGENKEETKE